MSVGPPQHPSIVNAMDVACQIPSDIARWPFPNTRPPRNPKLALADGVFRYCAKEAHCGLVGVPLWFLDGAYFGHRSLRPCDEKSFSHIEDSLSRLFVYHTRSVAASTSELTQTGWTTTTSTTAPTSNSHRLGR